MDTICLDRSTWDLCLDINGNIALATTPYARSQDVASAIRVFLGECWYDQTIGIPYRDQVIGKNPAIFASYVKRTALTVPGVVRAQCYITGFSGRQVTGQVQFTDSDHVTQTVALIPPPIPATTTCQYVGPNYVAPDYVR